MSHTASTAGDAAQTGSGSGETEHKAGLFDIRTFIGTLLGIYGVVLLLVGIFGTSDADKAKADGININLWVGIGLIVAGAIFEAWKRLRPVKVDESVIDDDDDRPPGH
jgi:hypothetical protein